VTPHRENNGTSGEITAELHLNVTKPNHLEKHLPPFEATHSNSDIHGNANKKGKSTRIQTKKTGKQQIRYISAAQD
jgi:hypothetical protein